MDFLEGQTLLFNKPKNWSSFDVVKKIRNIIRIKKVGHAGTLDPLATGLLILCTGKHTKRIESLQGMEKEYLVEYKLGATTPSYDAELPEENIQDASHITQVDIENSMQAFRGEIEQVPPIYSAVKIKGKRAYKAARAGEKIELKPRKIHIYEYELLSYESPEKVKARIVCSKGTYIRSIVHDIGQLLKVGAYMTELERTRIGGFKVEDAWTIEEFQEKFGSKPQT